MNEYYWLVSMQLLPTYLPACIGTKMWQIIWWRMPYNQQVIILTQGGNR